MDPLAIVTGPDPALFDLASPDTGSSSVPEVTAAGSLFIAGGALLLAMLVMVLLVIATCAGIHRRVDRRRIDRARMASTSSPVVGHGAAIRARRPGLPAGGIVHNPVAARGSPPQRSLGRCWWPLGLDRPSR